MNETNVIGQGATGAMKPGVESVKDLESHQEDLDLVLEDLEDALSYFDGSMEDEDALSKALLTLRHPGSDEQEGRQAADQLEEAYEEFHLASTAAKKLLEDRKTGYDQLRGEIANQIDRHNPCAISGCAQAVVARWIPHGLDPYGVTV